MAYPTAPAYTYTEYSPKTKTALPSLPTGTVSGSRLLLLVAMEVDKAEDEVTATLSGAKEVGKHARVLEGNAQAFELEYKGSAFPEITFSRSCEGGLILIRLEGEGAITAGSGWTSKTASSTVEAAAMTPSAEALVLACFFNDGGFHYSEPSSGWSSVAEGEFFFAVLGKDVKAGESSGVGSAKMGGSRAYLTFTVGIEAGVSPVTLAATAAITAETAGASKVARSLTAAAAAAAATTASLEVAHTLLGAVAAEAATAGALDVAHGMQGTVASEAGTSGTLGVEHGLSGAISAESATQGTAKVARQLTGTVGVESATQSTLDIAHTLTGTISVETSTQGSLAVSGGTQVTLSGSIEAVASSAAALSVVRALGGVSESVTSLEGALVVSSVSFIRRLPGLVDPVTRTGGSSPSQRSGLTSPLIRTGV